MCRITTQRLDDTQIGEGAKFPTTNNPVFPNRPLENSFFFLSFFFGFVLYFFQWNEKKLFWLRTVPYEKGILELKIRSQLICYIIINKFTPKMVWSSFQFFNQNINKNQNRYYFISFLKSTNKIYLKNITNTVTYILIRIHVYKHLMYIRL